MGPTIERSEGERQGAGPPVRSSAWLWMLRTGRRLVDRLDAAWSGVAPRFPPGPSRDTLLALGVVLYLGVDSARKALDDAIESINPAGENGVGVNSLHNGSAAVEHAFDIWRRGAERLDAFLRYDPVTLAIWQTVLELVLVPVSTALLLSVALHLYRRAGAAADRPETNVMGVAVLGAVGYGILGVFNQVAELLILAERRPVAPWTQLLSGTGTARPILLALTLLPTIVVAVRTLVTPLLTSRSMPPSLQGVPSTYRIMIAAVVIHATIMLVSVPGAQIADALQLWVLYPRLGIIGIVATVLLSITIATFAIRTGNRAVPIRRVLGLRDTWWFTVGGAALVALGLGARATVPALSPALLAAGIIALGLGLTSLPLAYGDGADEQYLDPPSSLARRTVPALLAAVPLGALTVALVRAAVPTIVDRAAEMRAETDVPLIWWAMMAGALTVLAYPMLRAFGAWAIDHDPTDWRFRAFGAGLFAVFAVPAVVIVADPVRFAPTFGVVPILAAFLAMLVIVFGWLAIGLSPMGLPAALDFVGFRKAPIVTGVIVLGLVSQQFSSRDYHDISTIDGIARPDGSQISIDEAFDRWVAAHIPDDASADPSADAVPMFFVAAAGGGIKAAAFTASTLNCLFVPTGNSPSASCPDGSTWDRVFVASGASGGSVGIASVIAEVERPADTERDRPWVGDTLGDDLLSASAAWQLFVEVPNAVLAFNPGTDRAAVLEATWRSQFGLDHDTLPYYRDRSEPVWDGPIAFFTGANLNDGCRVNVSAVRGAATTPVVSARSDTFPTTNEPTCTERRTIPAGLVDQTDTRDVVDYLCDDDASDLNIDLATAAFLSARFPYVSPTGTARCEVPGDGGDPLRAEIAVGDGGYRDNSGASTIAQLWSVLEPEVASHNRSSPTCIVPILIEVNSGYAGHAAPDFGSTASQFVAPALGAAAVYGDLSDGQIEELAAAFTRPLARDLEVHLGGEPFARHLRVSLVAHPGVMAPLGWSLSTAAAADLASQLELDENRAVLDQMRTIIDSPDQLTCVTVER